MPLGCSAPGCKNRGYGKGFTFHRFPNKPDLRQKWMEAIGKANWESKTTSVLCSKHFREEHIDRTSLCIVRIRENAIPSLFPDNPIVKKGVEATPGKKILQQELNQGDKVGSKKCKTSTAATKKYNGKRKTNVERAEERNDNADENKDDYESMDIEESTAFIKQEALKSETDMMVDREESDAMTYVAGGPFVSSIQERVDSEFVKTSVNTVSSLHTHEDKTIIPDIVPVKIKSEPLAEEADYQETNCAALNVTSNDTRGWECISEGCQRVFRSKEKMEVHVKQKCSKDDHINNRTEEVLGSVNEVDQQSTSGLLSSESPLTSVGSTNGTTIANWSALSSHSPPPNTMVFTAPSGDSTSTEKYLVLIPTQPPAGVRTLQPILLPFQAPSPTPSSTPPLATPPLLATTTATEHSSTQPLVADSSETLTIVLSQFDESTRVGIKKKIFELLDAVKNQKLNPDKLAIVYYNNDFKKN